MNSSLLQSARVIVENQAATSENPASAALWSIGAAHHDIDIAKIFLQQAIEEQYPALPLQGVALHHLYQYSEDKKKAKAIVIELFSIILNRHRLWYEHHDMEEEGLPYTPHAYNRIQDPLFLALLVWSNESLIQLGQLLQEDVLEIIQWNELTIYSMNEKLWNAEQRLYQAYDQVNNQIIETDIYKSFAPMAGEIPTQDQAELMFVAVQRSYKKAESLNVFEQWLLYCGLLRYDFVEMAAQIRQHVLQCVKEYGFYENFNTLTGEPLSLEKGQSPLTAALTIDLLKRC